MHQQRKEEVAQAEQRLNQCAQQLAEAKAREESARAEEQRYQRQWQTHKRAMIDQDTHAPLTGAGLHQGNRFAQRLHAYYSNARRRHHHAEQALQYAAHKHAKALHALNHARTTLKGIEKHHENWLTMEQRKNESRQENTVEEQVNAYTYCLLDHG